MSCSSTFLDQEKSDDSCDRSGDDCCDSQMICLREKSVPSSLSAVTACCPCSDSTFSSSAVVESSDTTVEDSTGEECSVCETRLLSPEDVAALSRQNDRLVTPSRQARLEREACKSWDLFYKRNETRFYKDRALDPQGVPGTDRGSGQSHPTRESKGGRWGRR